MAGRNDGNVSLHVQLQLPSADYAFFGIEVDQLDHAWTMADVTNAMIAPRANKSKKVMLSGLIQQDQCASLQCWSRWLPLVRSNTVMDVGHTLV